MILWYLIVCIILCLVAACEYYTLKTGVPTVTSTPSVRKKMIELLQKEAAMRGADSPFTILDLGSGTGKLALEIGKALPNAQIVGLEISFVPFLIAQLRRRLWRVSNVTFKREDFWPYDVSNVNAVTLYMNGKIRERMAQKLRKELPSGAFVISNETHMPDWTPIETHAVGLLKLKLVAYRQS